MIKIAVCGARGRMGLAVCRLINENPDLEIAGLFERPDHEELGFEIDGVFVTADINDAIKDADVIVDFSSTETSMQVIEACLEKDKKVVVCTTGFTGDQVGKIKQAAEKIPLLLSPNMSVGVNLVFQLVEEICRKLPDFEKEIIEYHHNKKVDAPSGTAVKIAEIAARENEKLVYGREGKPGPRPKNEIGIHAVRAGSIVGEHTIMWASPYERIELTHRAESREVFAAGALKAAIWLNGMEKGQLYNMADVLK
jgi:4-hydroxy-tetrahydrodipicolinate reductase